MAIADRMAAVRRPGLREPRAVQHRAVWLAVLAYAIQIYCDFSGYSRHGHRLGPPARLQADDELQHAVSSRRTSPSSGGAGTSRSRPGCATTCSSRWAAAAASRWLNYRNLMITMALGGLWHGAAWGYVLWGIAHGMLLVVHKQFKDYSRGHDRGSTPACNRRFGTGLPNPAHVHLRQPVLGPVPAGIEPRRWRCYEQLFHIQQGLRCRSTTEACGTRSSFVLACASAGAIGGSVAGLSRACRPRYSAWATRCACVPPWSLPRITARRSSTSSFDPFDERNHANTHWMCPRIP